MISAGMYSIYDDLIISAGSSAETKEVFVNMMQTSGSEGMPGTFDKEAMRGVRWRVMASILGGTAWIIFFLLFVAFIPTGFSLFQSIAVIIASILAIGAIVGAMWASYGMRQSEMIKSSD